MIDTLTGATRYRIQSRVFGGPVLVLQVEVRRRITPADDGLEGEYPVWRDAKVEDLETVFQGHYLLMRD